MELYFWHFSADAFFKAAVTLLPDVPRTMEIDNKIRSTDPFMLEYVNNLTSALLVLPVCIIIISVAQTPLCCVTEFNLT